VAGGWTDERREEASQRAKRLFKEGRLGGKQPGAGRPKKQRASEKVAEAAKAKADKIVKAFEDAIDESNPASVRLSAAREWLKVEQDETKLQMEEERHVDQLQTNQLIQQITQKISRLQDAGVIGDVVDAEVIDVIEEGASGLPEGPSDSGEEDWSGWAKG